MFTSEMQVLEGSFREQNVGDQTTFSLERSLYHTPTSTNDRRLEGAEFFFQYTATLHRSSCQVRAVFRQVAGTARAGRKPYLSSLSRAKTAQCLRMPS